VLVAPVLVRASLISASFQWVPVILKLVSVGAILNAIGFEYNQWVPVFSESEQGVFFQSTFYQKLKEARTEAQTGQSQSFFDEMVREEVTAGRRRSGRKLTYKSKIFWTANDERIIKARRTN
jgi:hypothetical protein